MELFDRSQFAKDGVLKFEYKGKMRVIPYTYMTYGGSPSVHLYDINKCVHIVNLVNGKWRLLWHERYSKQFQETLDWVMQQEFGNK